LIKSRQRFRRWFGDSAVLPKDLYALVVELDRGRRLDISESCPRRRRTSNAPNPLAVLERRTVANSPSPGLFFWTVTSTCNFLLGTYRDQQFEVVDFKPFASMRSDPRFRSPPSRLGGPERLPEVRNKSA